MRKLLIALIALLPGGSRARHSPAGTQEAKSGPALMMAPANFDDLVAAAQKEGQLTVIALPHDWVNYGEAISTFLEEVRDQDQRAEPGRRLGRRDRGHQGEQGQQGPAGAGCDRRRPFLRSRRQGRRAPVPVQGPDVEHHPRQREGRRRLLVRRLLRRAGLRGESRRREDPAPGLGGPPPAGVQGPGCPGR